MRIMEIISGTAVNGAVVHCLETTRALAARGHQMTLVCRPGSWIAQQIEGEGIECFESDLHRWPTDQLTRIAGLVRDRGIEVVHTHMSSASFFGVLLRHFFGIPACVATAHNRYIQLHWMFNDRVIAVSEATKQFHRRYNLVPPSRIDVVHNFIDDKRFHTATAKQGLDLRAELNIGSDQRVIGVVGNVIPRKGLIHLLNAMPAILSQVPSTQLLVVGYNQEEYGELCVTAAERLGVSSCITWAGARDDVGRVLAAIDVYALPSLEENMPLAILEAMASARPVVASGVGGIPECVVDGETGILTRPADETALTDALVRLLSDSELRDRMGAAGRRRVSHEFTADSQIGRIEQVFQRAAA